MKNDFISSLTLRTIAEKLRKELEGETMHPDFLDAMRYVYDCHMKKKEKENMNDIKWKVEQINVDSGIDDCELSVEINGTFTNNGVFRKPITFDGLAKEIEHRLNDDPYHRVLDMDVRPKIKDVIFNDPATIVFWADGTKTVVKCQEGDEFDPEKGLTMAIVKKVYGNKGSYCNEIKKWCEPYYEKQAEIENQKINEALDALAETAKKILGSIPTIKLNIESKKSDAE